MPELYAFLCIAITELILKASNRNCLGCINLKKLAINHTCQQISLLDKYQSYYNEVIGKISDNLKCYISHFIRIYPDHAINSEEILITAKNFLRFSTPKTLYFGGYAENEELFKDSIEAIVENGIITETLKTAPSPNEKPKPLPKRPRKNVTAVKRVPIEKTLSDSYDTVPFFDVN